MKEWSYGKNEAESRQEMQCTDCSQYIPFTNTSTVRNLVMIQGGRVKLRPFIACVQAVMSR